MSSANRSLSNGSPGCKALRGHLRSNAVWNFGGSESRFAAFISFINFVSNAIYMLIRFLFPVRRFFQSLSPSPQSKQKASSAASAASIPQVCETDETTNKGIRRKFLRTLASESKKKKEEKPVQVGGDAREEAKKSMVSFTLSSLLDFQHRARDFAELQHEPERNKRKRPNYNNSRRAFFAKGRQPMNHEFLVVQTVSISKLLCCPVFSRFTKFSKFTNYLSLAIVADIMSYTSIIDLSISLSRVILSSPVVPRLSANGMSESRLRRLQSLDKCRCARKTCFEKLANMWSNLLQFLQIFWSLAKPAQDLYVRA